MANDIADFFDMADCFDEAARTLSQKRAHEGLISPPNPSPPLSRAPFTFSQRNQTRQRRALTSLPVPRARDHRLGGDILSLYASRARAFGGIPPFVAFRRNSALTRLC